MPHNDKDPEGYRDVARKMIMSNPIMRVNMTAAKVGQKVQEVYREGKHRAKKYIERVRPRVSAASDRFSRR
jgi:hypothetical protein